MRRRVNTIVFPSGDQAGSDSKAGVRNSGRAEVPSALIDQISGRGSEALLPRAKTIVLPSGEKLGVRSGTAFSVRRRRCVPSAWIAYSSSPSYPWLGWSRVLENTRVRPSGAQEARPSPACGGGFG